MNTTSCLWTNLLELATATCTRKETWPSHRVRPPRRLLLIDLRSWEHEESLRNGQRAPISTMTHIKEVVQEVHDAAKKLSKLWPKDLAPFKPLLNGRSKNFPQSWIGGYRTFSHLMYQDPAAVDAEYELEQPFDVQDINDNLGQHTSSMSSWESIGLSPGRVQRFSSMAMLPIWIAVRQRHVDIPANFSDDLGNPLTCDLRRHFTSLSGIIWRSICAWNLRIHYRTEYQTGGK